MSPGWLWAMGVGTIRCDLAGAGAKRRLEMGMTHVAFMEIWTWEKEGGRYPARGYKNKLHCGFWESNKSSTGQRALKLLVREFYN